MRIASIGLPLAAALLVLMQPAAAQQKMTPEEQAIYDAMIRQAGVDPAAVHQAQSSVNDADKWLSGKGVVHYHVVGVYKGTPNVIGSGGIGYADVTDRVEIDFDWKLAESRLVGTPTFRNFKSAVGKLRDYEAKCRPPVLNGPYEHFEITGLKQGLSGTLDLLSTTSYPPAQVAQFCTGSNKSVPARIARNSEQFAVLSPVLFNPVGGNRGSVRVSADGKSLIASKAGWTWTYTPSRGR